MGPKKKAHQKKQNHWSNWLTNYESPHRPNDLFTQDDKNQSVCQALAYCKELDTRSLAELSTKLSSQELHQKEAILEQQNSIGLTPLGIALEKNHQTAIEYLLQQGSRIEKAMPNSDWLEKLLHAPCSARLCAQALRTQTDATKIGALNLQRQQKNPFTAVFVTKPCSIKAQALLDAGVDPNNFCDQDNTLTQAITARAPELYPPLIDAITTDNIHRFDARGFNPFYLSCLQGNHKLCNTILDRHGLPKQTNQHNQSPLHILAQVSNQDFHEGHKLIIKALIEKTPCFDQADDAGNTPLLLAAAAGTESVAMAFLPQSNLAHKNHQGHDCLFYAVKQPYPLLCQALLQSLALEKSTITQLTQLYSIDKALQKKFKMAIKEHNPHTSFAYDIQQLSILSFSILTCLLDKACEVCFETLLNHIGDTRDIQDDPLLVSAHYHIKMIPFLLSISHQVSTQTITAAKETLKYSTSTTQATFLAPLTQTHNTQNLLAQGRQAEAIQAAHQIPSQSLPITMVREHWDALGDHYILHKLESYSPQLATPFIEKCMSKQHDKLLDIVQVNSKGFHSTFSLFDCLQTLQHRLIQDRCSPTQKEALSTAGIYPAKDQRPNRAAFSNKTHQLLQKHIPLFDLNHREKYQKALQYWKNTLSNLLETTQTHTQHGTIDCSLRELFMGFVHEQNIRDLLTSEKDHPLSLVQQYCVLTLHFNHSTRQKIWDNLQSQLHQTLDESRPNNPDPYPSQSGESLAPKLVLTYGKQHLDSFLTRGETSAALAFYSGFMQVLQLAHGPFFCPQLLSTWIDHHPHELHYFDHSNTQKILLFIVFMAQSKQFSSEQVMPCIASVTQHLDPAVHSLTSFDSNIVTLLSTPCYFEVIQQNAAWLAEQLTSHQGVTLRKQQQNEEKDQEQKIIRAEKNNETNKALVETLQIERDTNQANQKERKELTAELQEAKQHIEALERVLLTQKNDLSNQNSSIKVLEERKKECTLNLKKALESNMLLEKKIQTIEKQHSQQRLSLQQKNEELEEKNRALETKNRHLTQIHANMHLRLAQTQTQVQEARKQQRQAEQEREKARIREFPQPDTTSQATQTLRPNFFRIQDTHRHSGKREETQSVQYHHPKAKKKSDTLSPSYAKNTTPSILPTAAPQGSPEEQSYNTPPPTNTPHINTFYSLSYTPPYLPSPYLFSHDLELATHPVNDYAQTAESFYQDIHLFTQKLCDTLGLDTISWHGTVALEIIRQTFLDIQTSDIAPLLNSLQEDIDLIIRNEINLQTIQALCDELDLATQHHADNHIIIKDAKNGLHYDLKVLPKSDSPQDDMLDNLCLTWCNDKKSWHFDYNKLTTLNKQFLAGCLPLTYEEAPLYTLPLEKIICHMIKAIELGRPLTTLTWMLVYTLNQDCSPTLATKEQPGYIIAKAVAQFSGTAYWQAAVAFLTTHPLHKTPHTSRFFTTHHFGSLPLIRLLLPEQAHFPFCLGFLEYETKESIPDYPTLLIHIKTLWRQTETQQTLLADQSIIDWPSISYFEIDYPVDDSSLDSVITAKSCTQQSSEKSHVSSSSPYSI